MSTTTNITPRQLSQPDLLRSMTAQKGADEATRKTKKTHVGTKNSEDSDAKDVGTKNSED